MKKITFLVLLTIFYTQLFGQMQPNGHTIKNLNFLSTYSNFPVGRVFQVYPSTNPLTPAEMYSTGFSGRVEIIKGYYVNTNRWVMINFPPFSQGSGYVMARTDVNTSLKVPCSALWELNSNNFSANGQFTPSGKWERLNFEGTDTCKPKKVASLPASQSLIIANTKVDLNDPNQLAIVDVDFCGFIWQNKNLNVTTYRDGSKIPEVKDKMQWASLTTGAWCHYDNDPVNDEKFGKLYNAWAVLDPRGLAPKGYHIPAFSSNEWSNIKLSSPDNKFGELKEAGTENWQTPNKGAIIKSIFNAIPAGCREENGLFSKIGQAVYFWTQSPVNNFNTSFYYLHYNTESLTPGNLDNKRGFSVRVVKD